MNKKVIIITKKHIRILKYIKKHPNCSTIEIAQKYKKQENVDILVLDLVANEYCRGIFVGSLSNPNNYQNLTLTIAGYEALSWKNNISIIKILLDYLNYY